MTDHVHTLVVGAGVVGLAIARRLAQTGDEVLMVERADAFGTETSSRNSEVIHAGMHYATGSLKARCCVAGRRMLYDYCRDRGVPHRRIGKLIVATTAAQIDTLQGIAHRAQANGLTSPDDALQWRGRDAVLALEPALRVQAALWSPSTGIVDTHGLMLALLGDAESAGAMLSLDTAFVSAERIDSGGWRVKTRGVDGEFEIDCTRIVNAAGLYAQQVASTIDGLPATHVPPLLWLKGNYFSLVGQRSPFSHLIYPVPSHGGLGVHLTMDLAGQVRFGPDSEPVEPPFLAPDYQVDPRRADVFYAAIRDYWPGLHDGALAPAYAGMRPKMQTRAADMEQSTNDFLVSGPAQHGLTGLVNLFGIESPGVTASMALAEVVAGCFGTT